MFRALLILVALCCAVETVQAQQGHKPITVTDLLQIKQLDDVALSPDGRQVLYSIRSIVPKEVEASPLGAAASDSGRATQAKQEYEYRTHLYLIDPQRPNDARQLTRGHRSAMGATWNPDGDRIAFVRAVDDTPQIFVLPLLGGEAVQVTRLESGASQPRWSPDGSRLLFSSSLSASQVGRYTSAEPAWPHERPGRQLGDSQDIKPNPDGSVAEIRAWLDANAAEQRPRVFHRLNLHGETDLEDAPTYRHWFIVDADSETAEPRLITSGYYDFDDGTWMADGERIIISGNMREDMHPDRVWETDLYTAAADGSGMRPFFSMPGYSVSSPVVSPDGNAVAFTARRTDHPGYAQTEVGVVPLDDFPSAQLLTLDFDRSASSPRWSPDGWHLYFTAASNGGFPLYRVQAFDAPPAHGGHMVAADTVLDADTLSEADTSAVSDVNSPPDSVDAAVAVADTTSPDTLLATAPRRRVERLTSYDRGIRSFDVGSATVYYVATEATNPYELYAANSPFSTDRRLTKHNSEWLPEKRLSVPESRSLTRDGREIQYWVMKPAFFDSTRTYPMLLEIHGGPSAMWGPGEASMWHEFQFFASRGYGIVFANPRGSGGYGYEFKRANYQDWGAGPAGDVLAVAAEAVREPWLDDNRQVVTGGSYAGYLTAWIVAHDHRFKAAVAQRGVYDLSVFLGEGNAWRLVPTHFGGYPWEGSPVAIDTVTSDLASIDSAAVEPNAGDSAGSGVAAVNSVTLDSVIVDSVAVEALAADRGAIAAPDTIATDSLTTVPDWMAFDSVFVVVGDFGDSVEDSLELGRRISPASDSVRIAPAEVLIRNSPITFVERIRTPLLIIHGDNDLRTGIVQSEVLYKSLKILGRPVEYVRYPNSGHELSRSGDPRLRLDRILRIYEFMERFIR